MRICSTCKLLKSEELFYKHSSIKPDGIRKKCNDCRKLYRKQQNKINIRKQANDWAKRNKEYVNKKARTYRKNNPHLALLSKDYKLRRNFGSTLEEFNAKLKSQNNVCAICLRPEVAIDPRTGKIKDLAVDHNHTTKQNRGLLCWRCNTGIGKLRDSEEIVMNALKYIRKWAA